MQITDIKFRHVEQAGKLKALVSVTFDGILAVHDIKIIDGHDRLFLAMPSRRMPDGRFRDIAHPVGHTLRDELEQQVLDAYRASFLQ
ncbi:septation regulator SpoVG [Agathobaculum sp.]|uniref:septation regulator SpoVG n=1 Tax=Agathobaculum sp. TaxID=2048138 RepID=UPI001F9C569B|nr:septation regulator SpoVG [Candidatus Agathobaculum intestinigallinarum]